MIFLKKEDSSAASSCDTQLLSLVLFSFLMHLSAWAMPGSEDGGSDVSDQSSQSPTSETVSWTPGSGSGSPPSAAVSWTPGSGSAAPAGTPPRYESPARTPLTVVPSNPRLSVRQEWARGKMPNPGTASRAVPPTPVRGRTRKQLTDISKCRGLTDKSKEFQNSIRSPLGDGYFGNVYRIKVDGEFRVLKVLKVEHSLQKLESEIEKQKNAAGVIQDGIRLNLAPQVIDKPFCLLESDGYHLAFLMEYWEGYTSLNQVMAEFEDNPRTEVRGERMSGRGFEPLLSEENSKKAFIETVFSVAFRKLDALQKAEVFHGDLAPQNMIVNSKTGDMGFIDFGAPSGFDGHPEYHVQESLGVNEFDRDFVSLTMIYLKYTGRYHYKMGSRDKWPLQEVLGVLESLPGELAASISGRIPGIQKNYEDECAASCEKYKRRPSGVRSQENTLHAWGALGSSCSSSCMGVGNPFDE